MFEELLDRAARSEHGRADDPELDRFPDIDKPVAEKRWTACLKADVCCRIRRFGRAHEWLGAASGLAPDGASLVWLADMASCEAELELAYDEPDRALHAAHRAWRQHFEVVNEALADEQAFATLLDEIDVLFTELCRLAGADPSVAPLMRRSAWVGDRFMRGVVADAHRLIGLAGSLGALDVARSATYETIAWLEDLAPFARAVPAGRLMVDEPVDDAAQAVLEASLGPMREHVRIELMTQLGDAEDACREHESAMRLFDEAAELAGRMSDTPDGEDRVLRLKLNSANQLAKLERHADAVAAYEDILSRAGPSGSEKLLIACRFGIVGGRWRQARGSTGLEGQMKIVAELEGMFLANREDPWVRGMLLSAYRLLVNMIAADRADLPARLPLLLQVLYAIRTPNAVAMLAGGDERAYYSARFGVDVLLARWSSLEGAVLLVWETGAEDLVLTSLASGAGPLEDRVQVACLPIERAQLLGDCIHATRDASEQISMRATGLKRSSASPMEQASRAVWDELPEQVRGILDAAETIYYSPSNQSALDEFPLEALHNGEGFLGVQKVICRVPSLRHLSDLLAANRYRQRQPSRALLVQAKDPERPETDDTVNQQTSLIAAAVDELSLDLEVLHEPSVEAFGQAVEEPKTLLHFVGHGFAGEGGEVLVLSESEQVPIGAVLSSRGARAPFTYFSACEVGRGRQMSSGAQRGLAATFLDAGAPAIVAPAYRIPSHALGLFAALFYQQTATLPAGLALTRTRALLDSQQYHPACWATVALFGDPYACLTGDAAAALPDRPASWKSLLFQHRATQDPQRQELCFQALEADARLRPELSSSISRWLRDGAIAPEESPGLLEELRSHDAEAAALLEILWTIQDVEDVNTDSPREEQESARHRLERCLETANALEDSYAAICAIEALGDVGVPMDALGSYGSLLDYEQDRLDMLSADSGHLSRIAEPLSERREKLGTMSFTNLGTTFGYTDENLERADQGDPRALREVALSMLEGSAHPDALTGVVPWYVWLLRWGGTGTVSSCRDVLGALKIDVKAGRLDQGSADAVRAFVGELQFSSPLDTAIVQAAVGAFEQTSVELEAIYLMWLKDTVETGGSVALSDVEAALAVAEELTDAMGPTGIAGWFRTVLVRNSLATGEIDQAARLAQEAVDEFAALQGPRQEYTTRLADAVRLAMAVAQAQGDSSHVTELEQEFASVLAEADTDEQRLRDDHGHLADFASDFRPTAGE